MRRGVRTLVVLGAIVLAFGAGPAAAGLRVSCPDATTRPFSPWGDYAIDDVFLDPFLSR
jgi:hypothetical protein